jgi:hypothetical protein
MTRVDTGRLAHTHALIKIALTNHPIAMHTHRLVRPAAFSASVATYSNRMSYERPFEVAPAYL